MQTGVFGILPGIGSIAEVTPGDIISIYVNGDATAAWRQGDNGLLCPFVKFFAARDVTALTRITVPRGVDRLVITSQAGPAQATTAAVASEYDACGA